MHDPVEKKKDPVINMCAHILMVCVGTYLLFSSAILMAKGRSHCSCVFLSFSPHPFSLTCAAEKCLDLFCSCCWFVFRQ